MTRYVVVSRKDCIPISDGLLDVEAAADYIIRNQAFDKWTVLAQEANRITPTTKYRALRPTEARRLEAKLFPSLFGEFGETTSN